MKHILIIFIATLIADCIASLQSAERKSELSAIKRSEIAIHELPHGKPEEVGMSSQVLKEIDILVNKYIDSERIEGAVIGITRQRKVIYFEANGLLNGRTSKPMTEDSIFLMASSTKPVIGVAAMILIDDEVFVVNLSNME